MSYYDEIKNELVNNEVYKRVKDYSKNRSDLNTYYNVGKLLVEAQGGEKRAKYGDELIKEYSKKLSVDLNKKYSERNLRNMRKFYLIFKDEIWQTLSAKLSWSHYVEILFLDNNNSIRYYLSVANAQNLSVRELKNKIKNQEYERLDEKTKLKLINKEELVVNDFVKNPIFIKNTNNYDFITEKILKKLILEDLENFMKELGDGFSFIGSEYKIKIGDSYNYIDLLLFNYIYNCFIVVELKVTELKKEYIGQIEVYMNYIDKNVKSLYQNKTIGIIIVRKDNKFILEYSSDRRIFETTYILK